jgi:hypothetical protein
VLVAGEHALPVDIVVEPNDDTPHALAVVVVAEKEDVRIAGGGARFSWQDGEVNIVELELVPLE